jgi:hypothetical protein
MLNPKFAKTGKAAKKIRWYDLIKDIPVKPPRKIVSEAEQFEAERNLKRFLGILLEADLKVLDEMIQKRKIKRQWTEA